MFRQGKYSCDVISVFVHNFKFLSLVIFYRPHEPIMCIIMSTNKYIPTKKILCCSAFCVKEHLCEQSNIGYFSTAPMRM